MVDTGKGARINHGEQGHRAAGGASTGLGVGGLLTCQTFVEEASFAQLHADVDECGGHFVGQALEMIRDIDAVAVPEINEVQIVDVPTAEATITRKEIPWESQTATDAEVSCDGIEIDTRDRREQSCSWLQDIAPLPLDLTRGVLLVVAPRAA